MCPGPFAVVQIGHSALLGLFGIAAALNGYLYKKIPVLFRVALIAGGLSMMIPGTLSDVAGLIVVGGIVLIQRMSGQKAGCLKTLSMKRAVPLKILGGAAFFTKRETFSHGNPSL